MTQDEQAFEAFWSVFPRKVKKPDALKAFKAALKKVPFETIVDAVLAQKEAKNLKRPKDFIPYPATWLRGEQWGDELEFDEPTQPRGIAGAAIRSMGNAGQNQGRYSHHAQLFFSAAKH